METNRSSHPGTATDEPVPSIHLRADAEAHAYRAGIAEGLRRARGGAEAAPAPDFDPVRLRYRRGGWLPETQVGFIRALAESGCVAEACRRVGMSTEGAYELARRPDAQSFRIAWDIAMDNAVRRVGDGAFSRAVNGVEVPHFYKGELVGSHRRYNERLTMFILRTRDPDRFGLRAEQAQRVRTREGRALDLAEMLHWVKTDAEKEARGAPRLVHPQLGASNDDDAEDSPAGRDLRRIYAFAPPATVDREEEQELEEESEIDDLSDAEADAVWRAAEANLRASLDDAFDEDDMPGLSDYMANALERVRAKAAKDMASPASAPDVPRSSSTSEPDGPAEEGTEP